MICSQAKAVLYTEGSVAVPCDAVQADLDGVLTSSGFTGRITLCGVMSRKRALSVTSLSHAPRVLNDFTSGR